MRTVIDQKLVKTGEKDKLKEYLRHRLVECGWRDNMKAYCKELLLSKGLEQYTMDDLIKEVTPRGRAMVPDEVRADLLARIRKFLHDYEK
ncbi:Transcription and mRNA export factor eny2 [Borealophlyctis nickersoniae]|nr:Transcription and mRNA export factor eny2 [Borealophlyctis nickersoniae]